MKEEDATSEFRSRVKREVGLGSHSLSHKVNMVFNVHRNHKAY